MKNKLSYLKPVAKIASKARFEKFLGASFSKYFLKASNTKTIVSAWKTCSIPVIIIRCNGINKTNDDRKRM